MVGIWDEECSTHQHYPMVGNLALRDSMPQLFLFVVVVVVVVVVDAAVGIVPLGFQEFGERNLQELRAVEEHGARLGK